MKGQVNVHGNLCPEHKKGSASTSPWDYWVPGVWGRGWSDQFPGHIFSWIWAVRFFGLKGWRVDERNECRWWKTSMEKQIRLPSKMGCWDSVWFGSSDIGGQARRWNSNPGYSFPKHIFLEKERKKKLIWHIRHEEDPLNNKIRRTVSKNTCPQWKGNLLNYIFGYFNVILDILCIKFSWLMAMLPFVCLTYYQLSMPQINNIYHLPQTCSTHSPFLHSTATPSFQLLKLKFEP